MKPTRHQIFIADAARSLKHVEDETVHLVITSPPYPLISMWDEMLGGDFDNDPEGVFNIQHMKLHPIFDECIRVLCPGGYICINIGDATRKLNGKFRLFSNHSKIIEYFLSRGLIMLPSIIWHKPTNSPTKFMGSGMLPAGAYVTLEHEHILIFKKAGKRIMNKELRYQSAYFWEERNRFFSDLWTIPGVKQIVDGVHTAAFPLEIPHRLINMFSLQDDIILDPFAGTGTTALAAMINKRNSIMLDICDSVTAITRNKLNYIKHYSKAFNTVRLQQHVEFIKSRNKECKYECVNYPNIKCISAQEQYIQLYYIHKIKDMGNLHYVAYYTLLSFKK